MTDSSQYGFACFDMRTELQKRKEWAVMFLSGEKEFCKENLSVGDMKLYEEQARNVLKFTVAEETLRTMLDRGVELSSNLATVSIAIADQMVSIFPVTSPKPSPNMVTVVMNPPQPPTPQVEKTP